MSAKPSFIKSGKPPVAVDAIRKSGQRDSFMARLITLACYGKEGDWIESPTCRTSGAHYSVASRCAENLRGLRIVTRRHSKKADSFVYILVKA